MPSGSMFVLPRRNLLRDIAQASSEYPLTVVTAPAGYGKTLLAEGLAKLGGGRVCRYSFCETARRADGEDWRNVMSRLERFKDDPAPPLLLLDNCRDAGDLRPGGFLDALIRTEPPFFRAVLFSRTRPELPLEELRLKGLASVYDQSRLNFSRVEARKLYQMHGVDDSAAADAAWKHSGGWPLALTQYLLHGGEEKTAEKEVRRFLEQMFFSEFDADEQELLMRLSVASGFTPEEATVLADRSGTPSRLRRLWNKNAFALHDPVRGEYRFHPVFRDYLRSRLERARDIDLPRLYRLAAECRIGRRDLAGAAHFLGRAGSGGDVGRLFELFLMRGGGRLAATLPEEIRDRVESAPWPLRLRHFPAYLSYIAAGRDAGGNGASRRLLGELKTRLADGERVPGFSRRRVRGEIAAAESRLKFNDYPAVREGYAIARTELAGPSATGPELHDWTFGNPVASFAWLREAGGYRALTDAVKSGHRAFVEVANGTGAGGESLLMAEYHLEQGNFEAARTHLAVAEHLAGNRRAAPGLALCRGRLACARGDTDEVAKMIARLSPSGAAEQPPATDLARGYLCAVAGKMKNIPEWLREGNIPDWLPGYGMAYAVYGKALLARGDYPALMELAEKMQSHRGCATLLFARIHALVFQATAAQRLDGPEAGASVLLGALELSEPDGLVFCLAEYGAEMSALLRDGVDRDDGRLEQIRSLAGMMGRMWRGDGGSGLTPREQSVMKLVVKGMSTPAIARRLKIAVVTVKKALGRAYSKLGARNRAEAAINYRQAYRAVPTKM